MYSNDWCIHDNHKQHDSNKLLPYSELINDFLLKLCAFLNSYRVNDPLQCFETIVHREDVVLAVSYG